MLRRSILLGFLISSLSAAQTPAPSAKTTAPQGDSSAEMKSSIRFDDASDKAGVSFTHSFGSAKLGSLLEGTGAGCVWFDFNNDGLLDLYILNGRPLDDSMHPYPLKEKPVPPPRIIYTATTAMAASRTSQTRPD